MWDDGEDGSIADQYVKCEQITGNCLILSQNIRSYRCNRSSLNSYLFRLKNVKILALQEIWKMGTENLVGFQAPFFRERENKSGGGVALFCASSLVVEKVDSPFVSGVFESVSIKTKINNKTYQIVSVYCPPKTNINTIISYINTIKINQVADRLILLGDFNVDILKPENVNFLDDLNVLGLPNLIANATRITEKSSTALDLIITNENVAEAGIIETDITDHLTTYLTILTKKEALSSKMMPLHDIRSLNYLKNLLKCIDWSPVLNDNSDESFKTFEKILHESRDICCPNEEKLNIKARPNEPWFSRGLRVSRKTKEKLFTKTRKKKGTPNYEKYITYRRIYNNLCKKAKIEYYFREFNIHKHNGRKIWDIAREVVGTSKTRDEVLNLEGCSNDTETASKFNDFFANIAPSLASKIKKTDKDFSEYLPLINNPQMKFKPVTEAQIVKTLSKMKNKVSFSHDFISNKLLRHVKEEIALPLSHLVTLSLKLSYVPISWKRAKVVPVFKSGSKLDPGNYRPISLLPTLSKVVEKVVHQQVVSYLNKNNILFKHQYGFRGGFSCEQLLLKLQDLLYKAKAKKEYSIMVFIDLKKAFDTTAHHILLSKIKHYGLPVDWFKSYLGERGQYTNIRCAESKDKIIEIGVPQGSILGPLLFLLYLNDMPLSTKLLSLLYADDTTYLMSNKCLSTLIEIVNLELKKVEAWFACNFLTLHPGKTRFILVGPGVHENVNIELCGQLVNRVGERQKEKSFKLVGVHLDENLSWKYHIQKIHSKVSSALSLIRRSKKHLPLAIKCMLYNSLIESHLGYCISIWGGPSGNLKQLEIAQKKAMRLITNSKYNAHTDPLFGKLKILKLNDLYEVNLGKLGLGILNNTIPEQIRELFVIKSVKHKPGLFTFYEPTCRTEVMRHFATAAMPRIWSGSFTNTDITKSKKCLANNFKNQKILIYTAFICENNSCYPCNI